MEENSFYHRVLLWLRRQKLLVIIFFIGSLLLFAIALIGPFSKIRDKQKIEKHCSSLTTDISLLSDSIQGIDIALVSSLFLNRLEQKVQSTIVEYNKIDADCNEEFMNELFDLKKILLSKCYEGIKLVNSIPEVKFNFLQQKIFSLIRTALFICEKTPVCTQQEITTLQETLELL